MSRSSGLALPDPMELLPYLALAGGAWLVFRPGPDGRSAVQKITGGLALPGVNPGGGDNQWGGGNGGNDTFNVNTGQSWYRLDTFGLGNALSPKVAAHVGVGHVGSGGQFSCVLWGSNAGFFGTGLGSGGPVWLAQSNFSVGHDGQWNGYGVDFSGVDISPINAGLGSVKFWTTIYSTDGASVYTTATLGAG